MYQVPSEEFLRENEIKQKKYGKIIGIIFMVASFLLTIFFGYSAYQSFDKYAWSETQGTVTYSEIFRGSTNQNNSRSYYEYEYSVDGVTYKGKDSETGSVFISQPPAQGTSINVYYNPNDPSESLVDTNYNDALSNSVIWTLCCGPFFFLFGAIAYFMSTRKQKTS
jgi:hypothetical protein